MNQIMHNRTTERKISFFWDEMKQKTKAKIKLR